MNEGMPVIHRTFFFVNQRSVGNQHLRWEPYSERHSTTIDPSERERDDVPRRATLRRKGVFHRYNDVPTIESICTRRVTDGMLTSTSCRTAGQIEAPAGGFAKIVTAATTTRCFTTHTHQKGYAPPSCNKRSLSLCTHMPNNSHAHRTCPLSNEATQTESFTCPVVFPLSNTFFTS